MTEDPPASDLLRGVKAIADHLNVSYWQAYGLIRHEGLPTFDLNGKRCARRSSVAAWLEQREAANQRTQAQPHD